MRAPAFWQANPPDWRARLLAPLGAAYGAVTLARMRRSGARVGSPVLCIGNFTAGGAGKTPTTIALTALLEARGESPFVLTRGYGGRLAGPVLVEPALHDAADVGDEALLTACHAPTIVARDRPAGAALAWTLGASAILMDDGLQNPSLAKHWRLAVIDGESGVGNGLCLPAGPLRAPLEPQIALIDAALVIGPGAAGTAVAERVRAAGRPILQGRLVPLPEAVAQLSGKRVLALAGIGRPAKFSATLRALGADIVAERSFADHHPYTRADVAAVAGEAAALGCLVATTEKDVVKVGRLWPAALRGRLVPVPVKLAFEDETALEALLATVPGLSAARRA